MKREDGVEWFSAGNSPELCLRSENESVSVSNVRCKD